MTVQNTFQRLQSELGAVYDEREAGNIADWVMEKITGWKKMDRLVHKQASLSAGQHEQLALYTSELLSHRPVQYVLGEAWFAGMPFFVNEQVLIPRPETEELVEWVLEEWLALSPGRVIDIGTGSGCIPVAIKKRMPGTEVYACDVSEAALEVAAVNAKANGTEIHFMQCDILDKKVELPDVDVMISNPPYIPLRDKAAMRKNVLEFEPHLALFVSDEDPLVFYRVIARIALKKLSAGGALYFEIDAAAAAGIHDLLIDAGFRSVEVRKDMQGSSRFVRARL